MNTAAAAGPSISSFTTGSNPWRRTTQATAATAARRRTIIPPFATVPSAGNSGREKSHADSRAVDSDRRVPVSVDVPTTGRKPSLPASYQGKRCFTTAFCAARAVASPSSSAPTAAAGAISNATITITAAAPRHRSSPT